MEVKTFLTHANYCKSIETHFTIAKFVDKMPEIHPDIHQIKYYLNKWRAR